MHLNAQAPNDVDLIRIRNAIEMAGENDTSFFYEQPEG